MAKIGKKSVGIIIAGILSLTTVSGVAISLNQVSVVKAASKALTDAKAHLSHLNYSLHNNYLGLKNQGQWESYISEIKVLIKQIPSSESAEAKKLTESLTKAEALVRALSRINQVEKSMEVNSKTIGNVKQWNIYLYLGDNDLERVDKTEFSKEVTELTNRRNVCQSTVDSIQSSYNQKAKGVTDLFDKYDQSNNIEDVKKAYEAALKLSKCDETEFYIYHGKMLLAKAGELTLSSDEIALNDAITKFNKLKENGITINDNNPTTLENIIKETVGSDITVKVTKLGEDSVADSVIFSVLLSKGSAKGYTETLMF